MADEAKEDSTTDNCPNCKGTGKMTSTFVEIKNGVRSESEFQSTCFTCMGQPVSKSEGLRMQKRIDAEKKMWCSCKNSAGTYYVPDTARMKHHWNCTTCKKIVQIG